MLLKPAGCEIVASSESCGIYLPTMIDSEYVASSGT